MLLTAPALHFPPSHQRWRLPVTHLVDKRVIERAEAVLLLGILWSALGICVLAALAYDVAQWFDGL